MNSAKLVIPSDLTSERQSAGTWPLAITLALAASASPQGVLLCPAARAMIAARKKVFMVVSKLENEWIDHHSFDVQFAHLVSKVLK